MLGIVEDLSFPHLSGIEVHAELSDPMHRTSV